MTPGTFLRHQAHPSRPRPGNPRPRRGVATIELLFAVVFLMVLAAMIFSIAYANLGRTRVLARTRHQAWSERDPSRGPAGPALPAAVAPLSGVVATEAEEVIRIFNWADHSPGVQGGSWNHHRRVTAEHFVLNGTWDHHRVDFSGNGPHLGVLARLASGSLGNVNNSQVRALEAFGQLLFH